MEIRSGLRKLLILAAGGILSAGTGLPCSAQGTGWKLSSSYNYESGKYGGPARTDITYVPFTLKHYLNKEASVAVTVPYLRVRGNTLLASIDAGTLQVVTRVGPKVTHSGLGDIILRGYYILMREDPRAFDLTLTGKIKMPTANKNNGLGTGKTDEGLGLEFGKRLYRELTLLADIYYTVIGSPAGLKLRNQTYFDLGLYLPAGKKFALTILYEESNALTKGRTAPSDVRGLIEYRASQHTRVFAGVLEGLSKTSSDYGITLGASRRF